MLGIEINGQTGGRTSKFSFTEEQESRFLAFSKQPRLYERIAKSMNPSIFGNEDIKKALACLLFGGTRKVLPDGMRLRGDVNVLLLGDPGTAKSQFLKFIEKVFAKCSLFYICMIFFLGCPNFCIYLWKGL